MKTIKPRTMVLVLETVVAIGSESVGYIEMITFRNGDGAAVRLASVMAILRAIRSGQLHAGSKVWTPSDFEPLSAAEHPLTRDAFASGARKPETSAAPSDADPVRAVQWWTWPNLSKTPKFSNAGAALVIAMILGALFLIGMSVLSRPPPEPNHATVETRGYVSVASADLWQPDEKGAFRKSRTKWQFDDVTILETRTDGYLRVRSADGVEGLVEAESIALGSGPAARERWCAKSVRDTIVNGQVLSSSGGGDGVLTVKNGNSSGAIVKLLDGQGLPILVAFVAAYSVAVLNSVPTGTYRLKFQLGSRYSDRCGRFISATLTEEFEDTFNFVRIDQEDGIIYTTEEITLNAVPNGKAKTDTIRAEQF